MQTIKTIILALALSVGASYLYAWTGPTASAPEGNVAAPVNVGSVDQVKSAGLGLNSLLVAGPVQIKNGTEGAGKVLTSDANGVATWQEAVAGAAATPAPSSVEGVPAGFKSSIVCTNVLLGPNFQSPTATNIVLYYSYTGSGTISTNSPSHIYSAIPTIGRSQNATSWVPYSVMVGFSPTTGSYMGGFSGGSVSVLTQMPSAPNCQNPKI